MRLDGPEYDSDTADALWREYHANRSIEARNELVMLNVGLVKRVAASMQSPPSDDMVSDGILGLIGAVERFDPDVGVAFSTYAAKCIRGTILTRKYRNSGLASDVSMRKGRGCRVVCMTDYESEDGPPYDAPSQDRPVEDIVAARELVDLLEDACGAEQQLHVVRALYRDGLRPADVSRELGCTQSNVHQLRDRALSRLREAVQC